MMLFLFGSFHTMSMISSTRKDSQVYATFFKTLFQLYNQTSRSAKYNSTVGDLKLMFGKYYK